MTVWTISAQPGTGGEQLAGALASRAGVPLLDRAQLAELGRALDLDVPAPEDLERRVCGRLNAIALSLAMSAGSSNAFRELQLRRTLPGIARAVLAEAAKRPCVIVAVAAFAVLGDRAGAVHVRLHAPLAWRVERYGRLELVDRRRAERAVRRADHLQQAWVKTLFGADVDDHPRFSLAVDVSRFCDERLVELLLAAGGAAASVGALTAA